MAVAAAITFYPAVDHWRGQDFRFEGPKPQITCNDVTKTFQKRKFLWNKNIVEQIYYRSFCATKKMRSCGLVSQKLKSENV